MGGNISGSSIQFHWSTCLSPILSSSYHNCSVALHVVRDTDSNRILFLVENSLSYPLFYSRIIWELLFLTLLRTELGFWWGLHESIDCFRQDVSIFTILILPVHENETGIFIFWGFLRFLSSETWWSYQRDISFIWLEWHQITLCCLWLFWRCHFINFFCILFILWV